jgi:hypothetical protein
MIQAADIERMGLKERLQTMELLWVSLARMPEAVPSPDWHGEVIATRLAKVEQGGGGKGVSPHLWHLPSIHVTDFFVIVLSAKVTS